jgi:hypothetical protein
MKKCDKGSGSKIDHFLYWNLIKMWPNDGFQRFLLIVETLKNCTQLWREAHFEAQMYKTARLQNTFGRWDVENVHTVLVRSTFRSQFVQKHPIVEALSEVGALKKCTPLWHEAHFQMKSAKNWRSRNTFGSWDVKKVHTVVARSTFPSEKC